MIDYGLSKKYKEQLEHIPFSKIRKFAGSIRYCSINAQSGFTVSRRDDLESLIYVLIEIGGDRLPWISEKEKTILNQKIEINLNKLCLGLPKEFKSILEYARVLGFEDRPDYTSLINMLSNALWKLN